MAPSISTRHPSSARTAPNTPLWISRVSTLVWLSAGTASNKIMTFKFSLFLIPLFYLGIYSPIFAQEFDDPLQPAIDTKDYSKAFRLTKADAERGDPKAAGNLGLMYEKGLGTPADSKLAVQWLTKAAKKGDAGAQNNLCFLYFNGITVKQDYAQALQS